MKAIVCAVLLTAPLVLCRSAAAEPLDFGPDLPRNGWLAVTFPRIPPASFTAGDQDAIEVSTDASAGLLWRPIDSPLCQARIASWRWMVAEGVPPTDLIRRGSDDRALGVYFLFGTMADATKTPLALLGSPTVTALVYVFGGDKPRGSLLPSPHMGARGKFLVLRSADAEKGIWFDETVGLARDYARAFGPLPSLLLVIAILSVSDDTGRRNRATLRTSRCKDSLALTPHQAAARSSVPISCPSRNL
jgi:hypothetical protein